jgi:hypothetical protein
MSELFLDYITISISYALFWGMVIFLILYPKLRLKTIKKRTNKLNKGSNIA